MKNIILLMGVSSAGKSTFSAMLMSQMSEFKLTGFDTIVEEHLPKKYWPGNDSEREGFYYIDSRNGPQLSRGAIGEKFMKDYQRILKQQILDEKNIIIDEVVSPELCSFVTQLSDSNLVRVCLKPPLQVIQQRELARGDRKVGLAKSSYDSFYRDLEYDIIFTGETLDKEDISKVIALLDNLNKGKNLAHSSLGL